MTHAFRRFIENNMAQRDWLQSDLVRESGITKQVVSGLLNDTRERLDRLPQDKTVDGLARAFGVERGVVLTVIGESMGLPMREPAVLYDASGVTNENLVRELTERLRATAPNSARGHLALADPQSQVPTDVETAERDWAARPGRPVGSQGDPAPSDS
jgi:transcriptional regulator with XRE-family HTH domain